MSQNPSADDRRHPAWGAAKFVATVASLCAMAVIVVPAGMLALIGWAAGTAYSAIRGE
ncbi:MAG: hypothetical protein IM629_12890 [Phenylobacterium sp.]|nr:hypothetical protein [Phenylobacterium sp.]